MTYSFFRAHSGRRASLSVTPEDPIRAEIFSVERLEEHAHTLAAAQRVTAGPEAGLPIASHLQNNARILVESYRILAGATQGDRQITPAAEWLLDNFHVVEEQIREIKADLPPRFYRELPKIAGGHLAGYPRVFGIAWAFVAHTDSRFDLQALIRFVKAYQSIQPLTIGELWAIAITLRLTLVENLRRLAEAIVRNRRASEEADAVADDLLGVAGRKPVQAATALRPYEQMALLPSFAAQLDHRLRDQDETIAPALRWLKERLAAQGTTPDQIIQDEVLLQSALNVTVRNVITSMRMISNIDWAAFFESVSLVDAALQADSEFEAMDFATRDLYRRAIEHLARGSGLTELQVARRAVAAAKNAALNTPRDKLSSRERDPGYYLIANGRGEFERTLKYRPHMREWLRRLNAHVGSAGYIGTVVLTTGLVAAIPLLVLWHAGINDMALLWLAFLAILPASDGAVALVNRAATRRFGPAILPAMELAEGVPAHLRTMIAMPVLLTSRPQVQELIEHLEVHHLASADGDLYFALLSDWTDADSERAAGDTELLDAAAEGIAQLNLRYGPGAAGERFLLLHRKRMWSESEGRWIGWERKRGKLHELNRLLRGATDTSFVSAGGGPLQVPPDVRFVITLDADTRLPRGAAKRMIGKMAHPLNRPRLEAKACRVVEGHAILQPRVTPSLPIGREGSLFQRVFSAPRGLDPYAFAVSDVYQDLFQEGSYTGKGIYDVDVFEQALDGRISENAVLSHDLLEGCFARAGLASDIEVVEEFPSRYAVSAARQHRWVRGDWQLLPWIFGFGRDARGRKRNIVHQIGRWKMIDNLRRSLSAPADLLAFLAGWMLPLPQAAIWTAFVLATVMLPSLLPWFAGLVPRRTGISKRSHLRGIGADLLVSLIQSAFLITFLMHQAWLMLDAVLRTMFRLVVRRRLLEWITAAQSAAELRHGNRSLGWQTAGSAGFSLIVFGGLFFFGKGAYGLAVPFLLLWTLSPTIAWWSSLSPPSADRLPVTEADARVLRLMARRTWLFFETFVTADENMLPPDNFQEDPHPTVAHRTSPTNIGLYLLAIVAARDFGWIGMRDAVERLEKTLAAMQAMERYRGHFYNWYDSTDLRPLTPKYVSTVDSGNLAGHLLVLKNACREMAQAPFDVRPLLAGICDAVLLASEALDALIAAFPKPSARALGLKNALDALGAEFGRVADPPVKLDTTYTYARLEELARSADAACATARTLVQEVGAASGDLLVWMDALSACIKSHGRDVDSDPSVSSDMVPGHSASVAALFPDRTRDEGNGNGDGETLVRRAPAMAAGTGVATDAQDAATRLTAIAENAGDLFAAMKFDFLYGADRQLFSIGYRVDEGQLDPSYYDLLASEARLASFVAIAKEEIPAKHWFRLGRTLTPVGHGSALISWSGSMFEYLMPSLVMRAPVGSIIDQTNRLVVRRQIAYGHERGVPWGVSESQYNARDIEGIYQYSSFGVPDLGYKRGLGDNIVIAPYATGLAAMIDPAAAAANFKRLAEAGGRGAYGWYEALDYTPSRVPESAVPGPDGVKAGIVRAYMAHHQAMSILAAADALLDGRMRARFHAEPIIQATELLLQERMPRDIAVARPPGEKMPAAAKVENLAPEIQRRYKSAHSRIPRSHLLSNGNYAVMLTGVGSGYSRWRNFALTRWHEDVTCDDWGSYIFLRDTKSGEVWSAGYQPRGVEPDSYEIVFSEARAEITRQDGTIRTTLEIVVSPESDAEVRRVCITNLGIRTREIELTSYAELVLAPYAEDAAHPAFAKLFVQTEFLAGTNTILATRRRKSPQDPEIWAAHLILVEGDANGNIQFETDRARFLGRGGHIRTPLSVTEGWPLSNTCGCVLDPIFSLRCRVRIPRGATAHVTYWTVAASSREEVIDLADRLRDATAFERVNTMAWTHAQGQFHHLGIGPEEGHLFQRIANRLLYSDVTLRPPPEVLKRGGRNMSALWPHGISGDLPIVVLRIDEIDDVAILRQLLRAYEYWRLKRLAVDLVILNERAPSYLQDLQGAIDGLVRAIQSRRSAGQDDLRGSVFVLRNDLLLPDIRDLLLTAARIVLFSRRGTLSEQINRIEDARLPAVLQPPRPAPPPPAPEHAHPRPVLEFFNGLGGFTPDGREYVTVLEQGQMTPAPWINVVTNAQFGFQVSAEGAGFTWAGNSQQNRLTPWSNDAVGDPPGEVLYLRDEDSAEIWCPTALPIRESETAYTIRHGQGYSRFEHESRGIATSLLQYVPLNDPVKISRLTLTNHSRRARRLSVTAYAEWVLGTWRSASAPYIVTGIDPETGAMFARNPTNNDFGGRVAFADLDGRQNSWTGDRTEFIGRDGSLAQPLGLLRGTPLSNRTGAGLDPCSALQTTLVLKPNASIEVVFLIGQAGDTAQAQALVAKYRTADLNAVFGAVTSFWDEVLGTIQVKTPDRALDILVNRWLAYQTLACRVWARSAFYQSSGAYGFRDQLQDVMALAMLKPALTREHLLRAASRQFPEGDVQHWWLPESGRGVRTRVSDDRIWLAYVAAHYVEITGDKGVLDRQASFIEGPVLRDEEQDSFFQPQIAEAGASLFEHCARGLDAALGLGAHGLPLMGAGDWNDGMNRVGDDKGESVWLGWFLYSALQAFGPIAQARGEKARAARWGDHAVRLKRALEESWDGDWYRRAYFGDGTPLGSVANSECRIDSIAQSWSVISGAAEPARAVRAMAAVEKYLVRRDDGLVLLFTPPFDKAEPDPGYIKGYPPGIRENGGQYTHGALWSVLAFTMLGLGDRAGDLLSLLNPIRHSDNSAAIHRYKVEPYVVCADIYSVPPHVGRGGWTWYTGSAAWMYRVSVEAFLGLRQQGAKLVIDPCIPRAWPGFEIIYRHGSARYVIGVENPNRVNRGVVKAECDGVALPMAPACVPLADDGKTHRVRIVLGS